MALEIDYPLDCKLTCSSTYAIAVNLSCTLQNISKDVERITINYSESEECNILIFLR